MALTEDAGARPLPAAPLAPAAAALTLPDHLILLPDGTGEWALWRNVCVRGAGFPAAGVLPLADPASAAAADRANAALATAESLRETALEAVRGELKGAGKERLDTLIKAIQRLKKRKPPRAEGLAEATLAAIESWQAAAGRAEEAAAELRREFAAGEARLSRTLREVARDELFREALLWQNRHASSTGLASLLRRPEGHKGASRDRAHEQMLAFYLQRYCTKNDTIGFFGPVGWGRLTEGEEPIEARPGPGLLAQRQIYFEGWSIDAVADLLARDEQMRPWLAPRQAPWVRIEGSMHVLADGRKMPLGPLSKALFGACDGLRPARDVVREVLARPGLAKSGEEAAYKVLADFHARGLISWTFQVPMSLYPERTLRQLLLAIGDSGLRTRALGVLDEIVAARDAVARAAGRPDELDRALEELEAMFTRATGLGATTASFKGRTLVYEDCRRDVDVTFGTPFLADLAPALSLLLMGARWYTHHIASRHRAPLAEVHARLAHDMGSPSVDLATFARDALPGLVNLQVQGEMQRELEDRWERALAVPTDVRRVTYTSAELRPRVVREFAAPAKGWMRALYHSPDLMVDAPSVEAIRQGDYLVVTGEIHLSVNTLDRNLFFFQHPHPERLCADMDVDLPEPSLLPVLPKLWNRVAAVQGLGIAVPGTTARVDVGLRSPKDFYLDLSLDPPDAPASQVLRIGDLVVEPGEGGLVVGTRDGRVRFEILEFFQFVLMLQAIKTFKVQLPRTYTPRIMVDRMVLTRESWIFPATELELARAGTAVERFAAARRWVQAHGMPRFLFVKTPSEPKPFFFDAESPASVELFARAVRQATSQDGQVPSISVTEMLPGPDRTWLPDAKGNRYTCELRTVAVDLT